MDYALEIMAYAMNFISGYMVPVIFIGLGSFILIIQYRLLKKNNYISTNAKIIKCSKQKHLINHHNGTRVHFGLDLEYEYCFLGQKYKSTNIYKNAKSYQSSDPQWPDELIKNYPVGTEVAVMVKKDNPSDSFLLEKSPGTWFINGLAILSVTSGILIWYFG